ncbi:MAG: hypothetical protein Fur0022_36810 [Anaerolineales bacterium]
MPYRFVTEKEDYSALASGQVFYNTPGHPAFPVRLMSEIFQRCIALRRADGHPHPVILYDPCCGAAYHLAVLGFLHRPHIHTLIGSDVDAEILRIARRNLALLTPAGLDQRKTELEAIAERFGKESHRLEAIAHLRTHLLDTPISTRLFQADATQSQEIAPHLPAHPIDLVFADVPYSQHSVWKLSSAVQDSPNPPLWHLLDALLPFVSSHTIVSIAADKAQKTTHAGYRRIERFQVGKRQILFFKPQI